MRRSGELPGFRPEPLPLELLSGLPVYHRPRRDGIIEANVGTPKGHLSRRVAALAIGVFSVLILAVACGKRQGVAPLTLEISPVRAAGVDIQRDYYPDRIIVKFASDAAPPRGAGTGSGSLPPSVLYQNTAPALFARHLAEQYGLDIEQEAYVREVNWACFAVDSAERASQLLEELPASYSREIEYTEYDGRFELDYVPNDPYYPDNLWGIEKINAEAAWDIATGSGIKIAVIDTGIRYDGNSPTSVPDHEDLNDNVMHPPDYWPDENLDLVDEDNIPNDEAGHGTHVAGTAAAVGDNATGVVGVAFEADIIPIKIFSSDELLYYSRAIQAITLAAELGSDVVNMSFAGSWLSRALSDALTDAYDEGVLLVAAAGNKALTKPWYPAGYQAVIAVGSTEGQDHRSDFSNYGPWLDIAAPGDGVKSTYYYNPQSYWTLAGTSMSAPHVAGTGALLMEAHPDLSVGEVRAILEGSGVDLPDSEWDNTTIRRLDAGAALGSNLGSVPTISITSPEDGSTVDGLVTYSVNVTDSDGSVLKVYFYVGDYLLAIDTTSPFSTTWDTSKFPNTTYELRAVAYDDQAQRATATVTVTVSNTALAPDYFTDFESGTSGWWELDESGPTSWHLSTEESYSPTHSFKMGDTGDGSYGNSEYDLLFSPVFDLSGIEHARVKFYHRHVFSGPWDAGYVTVNLGDGEYHVLASYTFGQYEWKLENLLLDDYLGKSIQVVFLMESNNTVNNEGWYIDDFRLVKSTNPPTVTLTSHQDNDVVSGTITIAATASDDVDISKVELYVNDEPAGTDSIPPYTFEFDTLEIHGGDNAFRVTAYDEFPLTASDEVNLIVQNQQVNSFWPFSATAGSTLEISGNNFIANGDDAYNPITDKVCFTGEGDLVDAEVGSWYKNYISCTVPAGAVIGPVFVVIGSASVASDNDFVIEPMVDHLEPDAQVVGETIIVHGSGFLAEQGSGYVTFNGLQALSVVSWSTQAIEVVVPEGVTAGPVKVTTEVGVSNGVEFTPVPHITMLSSSRAYVGKLLTIFGTSFGSDSSAGSVWFHNGVEVPGTDAMWQSTQIGVFVPAGVETGNVYVTVNGYESNRTWLTITLPPPHIGGLNQY